MKQSPTVLYLAESVSMNSESGDSAHVEEFTTALARKDYRVVVEIRGKTDRSRSGLISLPDFHFPFSIFTYLFATLATALQLMIKHFAFVYQRDSGLNIGLLLAKIRGVPVILEINGDFSVEYSNLSSIIRAVFKIIMHLTYSMADLLVIPSENQIKMLKPYRVDRDKVLVVPNGVNPKTFVPMSKTECRMRIGLNYDHTLMCFVGNLAPWQGLDTALLAFYRFCKLYHIESKFLIVGDGVMLDKLRRLASDLSLNEQVIFFGSVEHSLVPIVINACDICVAPFTSWRNKEIGVSPLKLMEYLSCGKPVITTAIPGATKLINELDAGLVAEPDNADALAKAYKNAVENLPNWRGREHEWHAEIAYSHSWSKSVDLIIERMQETRKDYVA